MALLDRWAQRSTYERPQDGLRYVVCQGRNQTPDGTVPNGFLFTSRLAAIKFGRGKYDFDYAVYALTNTGSVDVTPVVRACS